MSSVKQDLFSQEVFVYSPRGDLIALSQNSTPIDFAYAIHSHIGHHCLSARVNGKQVPLSHTLENGDAVEIVTSDSQTPSKDWLNIVATTKAKQRIRSWLKSEERKRSVSVGRELLLKEFRRLKRSFSKALKEGDLERAAPLFGLPDSELLLAEIGYGKLHARAVMGKLYPEDSGQAESGGAAGGDGESTLQKIFQRAAKPSREKATIKVHGLDDVVFRLAKCCEPLPGDDVVGYVTRGRGVAVHRRDCPQALTFDEQRIIEVSWDDSVKMARPVSFRVHCLDQVGMLAALTQSISSIGVNIINLEVRSQQNGKSTCSFEVNIESSQQLDSVTRKLESVEGVLRVERRRKGESEATL
jgi:guanosine-3',5'-bis(diphosphate) 3'-pyrophosphohydrolase